MILRQSSFVHLLPLGDGSTLAIHAVTQSRVPLAAVVVRIASFFATSAALDAAIPSLAASLDSDQATIRGCILMLLDRGILTADTASAETAAITHSLRGHDPAAALDRHRRAAVEGSHPYWSVEAPRDLADITAFRHRVDVLLFGDCDVQMETDFLRREAATRAIDLRPAASFAHDTALAGERKHDIIIIGALQARHAIALGTADHHDGDPSRVYVQAVQAMLLKLRALSPAPILVDALPEPTLQPLGIADQGPHSHRNRFRRTNLALEALAETIPDIRIIDTAAALAADGAANLLDDGLVSFTHFGSPGWMLQRPDSERAGVHDQFPDLQPLAGALGGDPYRREAVMARAHVDAITAVLALDQKKCVIVDLDGVLWPGVLAETGSPFAWAPDVSSPNSYIGLYFGIHEALRALHQRGILLACVSKNDEAAVRALWHYPEHYPHHRLLTPDSFVTWRVNWDDKAANIQSIADELGFAMEAFVFIDDSARERARVQQSLPDVTVLGEDLFTLRRTLLTDPRLQPAHITAEAGNRTALVRAQFDRTRHRGAMVDEDAFIASLEVVSSVDRITPGSPSLGRIGELLARTTQFNTTGRVFSLLELQRLAEAPDGRVYTLHMRDRFADHGLVGAAIILDGSILNVALSCRVIGLGGEHALLARVIADAAGQALRGRIVATDRNIPVRKLYAESGFTEAASGSWTLS